MAHPSDCASCPVVTSLSEGELLAQMVPLLPRGERTVVPSGDDCAVIALQAGNSAGEQRAASGERAARAEKAASVAQAYLAVSTDMLVENVHFRREWSTGFDVGYRCAMQNLADAVAMGARPRSLVIAMSLPRDLPVCWLEAFSRGLAAACPPGVGVDGGDLTTGEQIVIGVTVLADMCGRMPVTRAGAHVGDGVYHCGNIGAGALGLALLSAGVGRGLAGFNAEDMGEDVARCWEESIELFLRPQPPLDLAQNADGVSAMMDVSDGLARDAERIANASGVCVDLSRAAVLAHPQAKRLHPAFAAACERGIVREADDVAFLLAAGEDHGFLATSPKPIPGWHRIGVVRERSQATPALTLDGNPWQGAKGWDHFHGESCC